jgi:hypothetical protein
MQLSLTCARSTAHQLLRGRTIGSGPGSIVASTPSQPFDLAGTPLGRTFVRDRLRQLAR